jgi:hypothetical protein
LEFLKIFLKRGNLLTDEQPVLDLVPSEVTKFSRLAETIEPEAEGLNFYWGSLQASHLNNNNGIMGDDDESERSQQWDPGVIILYIEPFKRTSPPPKTEPKLTGQHCTTTCFKNFYRH